MAVRPMEVDVNRERATQRIHLLSSKYLMILNAYIVIVFGRNGPLWTTLLLSASKFINHTTIYNTHVWVF